MRTCSLVLFSIFNLVPSAFADSKEPIDPTVLIEAKNGNGPSDFAIDPDGGGPSSFVVTGQEHLYVLDALNNRVQQYDSAGNWVGSIAIPSTYDTTEKERKLAPMLTAKVPSVFRLELVDGKVSAVQFVRGKQKLLQMNGDNFALIDGPSSQVSNILPDRRDRMRHERIARLAQTAGLSMNVLEHVGPIWEIAQDGARNVWVVYANSIQIYSPAGVQLAKINAHNDGVFLSKLGNLYVLRCYSTNPDAPSSDRVRILKYSLQGK